jgi:hypothetical protein
MFAVAALMIVFFATLSALTTTAINVLSFRWGSISAFLVVYLIEAMMVFSLLIPSNNVVMKVWSYLNPFGGIFNLEYLSAKIIFQIFYVAALFAALTYAGGKYIARIDIGLKDVEAG